MPRLLCERAALRRLLACTTAIALFFPTTSTAGDLVYASTGNWWFDPNNWIEGTVPGSADTATVDGTLEALIASDNAFVRTLFVGRHTDGSVLIRDPLSTYEAIIGADATASGTATLSGTLGDWSNDNSVVIGDQGTGTLNIAEGASASFGTVSLGLSSFGSGNLALTGEGSKLNVSGTLDAGYGGDGAVLVSTGAWLASGGARLGVLTGANGALTVDRQGSTFLSSSLIIGEAGTGSLSITAGGVINIDGDTTLGRLASGNGTASIRGAGSLLSVNGALTVGNAGTGALTVSEAASLSSRTAIIGALSGASGSVHLSGLGTSWIVTDHLGIGAGSLTLDTASTLSTGSATLGTINGETASASLSGSGTAWQAGTLAVGDAGTGTLDIRTGASVQAVSIVAADRSGSNGTITVDGGGSTLSVDSAFDIGRLGMATLTITAGAKTDTGSMSIGTGIGSMGTVLVDGDGSTLSVTGDFDVGRFGKGTLTVSGSATVSADTVTIAREAGSTGTLNIGAAESSPAAGAGTLDTAAIYFGEGDGTLVFNHGETNYELAAAISGIGTVKAVRGTTILTGENSYGGETLIASGATLAVGNGGDTGTLGTGNVTNDGSLIFDRTGNLAFAGAISGTGSVEKTGSGTLNLSGDNTYTGTTSVSEGRLDVDGSLVSTIAVANGATLGGSGTIASATIGSGGTLAAEGLHASVDLTLASGSTLAARIGDAGIATTTVGNTATIDGATLALTYDAGGLLSNHYTVVEAGSLTGGFGAVSTSGLSSRFTASGASSSNTATVNLVYDGSGVLLAGQGANSVHAILGDAFNAGTDLSGSLSTALASDGTALQKAMTTLSGETGVSARIMGLVALEDFLQSPNTRQAAPEDDNTGVWARMTGQARTLNGSAAAGISRATMHLAGIEGGTRFAFDETWTGGVALSLGHGRYSAEDVAASATGRYAQAALQASGHFAGGSYFSAALGAGLMATDTDRNLGSGDRVKGDFTSRNAGLDLEAGQRFDFGDIALTLFAGASLIYGHAPGYAEQVVSGTGNPALAYLGQSQWQSTIRAGFDARYDTAIDGRALSLYTRLAYQHRFTSDNNTRASFIALPASYFDLEGLTREGGAFTASVGTSLALGPQADLTLDLGGEWSAGESSVSGRLGLNVKW